MRFEIPGNPITKKNSQRIIRLRNGRPLIKPSEAYEAYASTAAYFLQRPEKPIDTPVNVKCIYYMKTLRQVDLTNLLEATDDILVECGVLKDDSRDILAAHDGSRVYYDSERPRVEIEITEVSDYPQWGKAHRVPVKPSRKKKSKAIVEDFDNDHWD